MIRGLGKGVLRCNKIIDRNSNILRPPPLPPATGAPPLSLPRPLIHTSVRVKEEKCSVSY